MSDDHEVDWGNDEDDFMVSRTYFDSVRTSHAIGGDEADDVEDAVSLGGDEEELFAAYGARPNEQNTHSADRSQNIVSRRDARRRSASVGVSPRKGSSQVQLVPLPPSPQSENFQPTPKLTHALPPKPVVSSVRAPPSTTAASPMSLPRKERRSNGNTTKKGDEPPPSDKETRGSHTTDRDARQRDSCTEEASWTRPSSGAADSQPLSRDRTRSFDDRDSRPSLRREDDCYRPSHHRAHHSSDEEGREPNPHRTQSRYDARYRYDDRDQRQDYASGDRTDRLVTRSARFPPEVESLDRSRTGYRESNDTDPRRAHPRDRDISPTRDDSARRLQRRDDYSPYDSFDKGPRGYDDPPRRSAGPAERSRYPESFNGRTNSVVLRDSHTQNQGPGRSSTLRRNSPSPRPRSRTPPYNRRDDRRHSPPRYQEYPSDPSRLPPYRGRADSPPPRTRAPDRIVQRDTPSDLPQRRPRGISDAHEPDYAPKRRKMDDGDINFLSARRGPVGTDTYIPQETSTASTSPRSTGAPDDLSRQRRREPLPLQNHRFKEASDTISRPPPLSGPNRIMRQPQPSALSHRHYPPSPKDHESFSSRHPDADVSRFDRSRGSGHDPAHVYVDKFNRDDHMKADPPYPPRVSYEEPVRSQDMANRTSSHNDAMSREPILPTSHPRRRESVSKVPMISSPVILENARGRSRDRSPPPPPPRTHHEPRRTGMQPSSAVIQSGPPQDMQFVEDHRHRERRIDREREGHSPTLLRSPSNLSAPERYDMPGGGLRSLRSPERHSAPSVQEESRYRASGGSNPRRERLVPPVTALDQVPSQLGGESISMLSPVQERPSRSGPPPDIDVSPPPPPPLLPAREWIPRQPEFMLSLPPPSTRLPGAPPPPILPPRPYDGPQDPIVDPQPIPPDESTPINLESETGQQPLQEKYRQEPPSLDRQMKDKPPPRSRQTQEGHHEQAPPQSFDRPTRASASDNLPKPEILGKERHVSTANEESRRKVSPEVIPASWDRPRDIAPPTRKPLTLPASLPPKPVAALGDLNLQQPPSLRTGHPSRGRRNQQQLSEESNNHGTRWGSTPRGEGSKDKDKERNKWGGAPEYQGPSLLARMSSDDSGMRGMGEIAERVGGEVQRKRARTRKYQGQGQGV